MRRRDFCVGIIGSATAWPLVARAQQERATRMVGILMGIDESDPAARAEVKAFQDALTKLGWIEGGNLRIELRWGGGDARKIRTLAKELVALRPDVILGRNTAVIDVLTQETRTIPIVFAVVVDPIGRGYVTSLARPGGNVTGFTAVDSALGGKWLEILKEIAPQTTRVALLFNPSTAAPLQFFMPSIQTAALSFSVQVSTAPVHAKGEIQDIIARQASEPGGSIIDMPDPFNVANRDLTIALAARYRVPTIYFDAFFAKSGGLIAYGSDITESFRQAAGYIDRILKGEKPADLAVQAPTKFELAINRDTANSLGLTIPPGLLATADELIE